MCCLRGRGGSNLMKVEDYFDGKIKIEGFGKDHPTKSEWVKVSGLEEVVTKAVEYLIQYYGKNPEAGGQKGKPV